MTAIGLECVAHIAHVGWPSCVWYINSPLRWLDGRNTPHRWRR